MSVTTGPATATARLPKLVATDLDGTLVRTDGSVSDYTRSVLRRLDDLGVPVIFVTGRPLRWTEVVFEHVGSLGLAIVSNGALVWDVAAGLPRLERAIAGEQVLDTCRRLRELEPSMQFALERLTGIALEPGFDDRRPLPPATPRGPIDGFLDVPVLKLLARHAALDAESFVQQATEVVGDSATVTWSDHTTLLEISAAGVTKASTLELIADELGVDADDVIAFGDMPNDLPMLRWAGTSYAMADAHPSVVSCATHVAPGHEEDGVARVLAGVFDL